jgi:hypothetical protein
VIEPWADSPLKDPNKDKLDRAPFVGMAVNLIENLADSNDSTVLGLVGPWGSGKSTVLNFIQRGLARDIKVVKFNPWSFDNERLQAELYSSIVSAFPDDTRESVKKRSFDVIRRTLPVLKFIPEAGDKLAELAEKFIPSESWDAAFEDLAGTIKDASVKVLVVVDDVDRLQPQELLLLMKTIRLLGRFPRVNYLLSYDRRSTIKTLAQALGGDDNAALYLEKIVQYPLDLPDPQQHFLQEIVEDALGPVVTNASIGMNGGPTPRIRFETFFVEHMTTTLTTPRACQRYVLQAKTFLSLAGDDVDPADFFALTFLRLFYGNLYTRLPGWIGDLTTTEDGYDQRTKPLPKEEWISRITKLNYTADQAEELVEALGALFPRTFDTPMWTMVGGKYRAYKREYFPRYFNFSLPAGDVSDTQVQEDLTRILKGDLLQGGRCPETFDHPIEGMQVIALRKGLRDTDYEQDPRYLVDYLSRNLTQSPPSHEGYAIPKFLITQWLSKAIGAMKEWTGHDVDVLVKRFDRPEALGYALQLHQVQSATPLDEPAAETDSTSAPTFADAVKNSWIEQAVGWLIEEWKQPGPDIPESERFTVWEYLSAFDGLGKLREATNDALLSNRITLTQLITGFTVCRNILGDTRALPSDLELVIPKLKETVSDKLLRELPLSNPVETEILKEGQTPTLVHRIHFAVEHLQAWRKMKAEAPGERDIRPPSAGTNAP